ncbi:MAG: hypothetical protein IID40_00150 [Planctomycetes bacterium]|nr:hypothetical protein [Planctomycetota bacterium]
MQQVKLISVTAVLTLLIWTTADQLLSETVEVQVTIYATPGGASGMIVETDPPDQNSFLVRLTGPKRIVDRVRKDGLPAIALPVPDAPNGRYPIDMKQALADYPERFKNLRVEAVSPPRVVVVIDHLVTVNMPVFVQRGDLEYEVPPTVEPAEVAVTLRQAALDRIPPGQRRVVLEVEDLLGDRPRGSPLEIPGAPVLSQVDGIDVQLEPNTVTVRATLREQSTTGTIAAVPIHIAASFDDFSRFRIETRDGSTLITRAINVRGPPAAVERLVSGAARVTGVIVLTGDVASLAGDFHELEPVFDLPAGVTLAGPVAPIEFRLVPHTAADGP